MDETGDKTSEDLQIQELINSIVAENNLRFEEAIKGKLPPSSMIDIPDEAFAVLTPKLIYQKVLDPGEVKAEIWRFSDERVLVDVPASYIRRPDTAPVTERVIDYVLDLLRSHPQTLIVRDFSVGIGLKGQRIGREFYMRLEHIAKALGLRFIIGQNDDDNIGFFVEKMGRTRMADIKPDLWDQIVSRDAFKNGKPFDSNLTTVQFLNPEDRATFMKSPET